MTLPWPPRELSPNARVHWTRLSAVKARYRLACGLVAKSQGATAIGHRGSLPVALTFCPPDRRRRDLDNMLASVKSGLDGLADVLGADDSRWTITIEVDRERRGGFVEVRY